MDQSWCRGHKDHQRVLVPPSRHVATSFQDIVESLANDSGRAEAEEYQTVAEQLDFATLHDFQIVRRRLKESFKPFNDAALHHTSKIKDLAGGQADQDELDFLEDLYALLSAAHFRVLSAEEWQSACDHDFTFTNPMDVKWTSLDKKVLSRFWRQKPDVVKRAACISDRTLIMHRGIKLSHAKGKFFQEKLDLLVEYLIADPIEQYVQPILQKYKISWQSWWPSIEVVDSKDTGLHRSPKDDSYKLPKRQSTKDPLLDHENAKWVTRVTLKDVMPDAARVCSSFFKEIHLQEPTFRELILLYRRAEKKGTTNGSKKRLQDDTYSRNIYIKRFNDIPNADLEMIFPDKTVYLKPVLLIQLAFTIVLGLISVLITLLTSEATWSVLGGILSIVGTRAYQVYTSATIGRQKVLDDITDRLYEQTMDAQEGVLYFLLDQMADQHVKELLLAYFLLLDKNAPMSQRQLDKACEEYLRVEYGERVDFALENSLPTLCEDGLIRKDSQGLLHAASLEESRKLLSKKGSSFFSSDKLQFKSNIPTFTRLSSSNLKKYMKNPQPAKSHLSSTGQGATPRPPPSSYGAEKPPLPPAASPKAATASSFMAPPTAPSGQVVVEHSNPAGPPAHVQSEGFTDSSQEPSQGSNQPVYVTTKPPVEYEDELAPQYTSNNASSLTGELRARAGHTYESDSKDGSTPTFTAPRISKKRSRPSRRAPTTVLATDTSNFRAMVQVFTGIPSPPLSSSFSLPPRLNFSPPISASISPNYQTPINTQQIPSSLFQSIPPFASPETFLPPEKFGMINGFVSMAGSEEVEEDFRGEKGLESARFACRGGMLDSWICSSD